MKKLISLIMAVILITALAVAVTPSASAAWDGAKVSEKLNGKGSEADPYIIANEADLALVAKQVNDAVTAYEGEYIKLTADLDLGNKAWTPIGNVSANRFKGNFDGNGHKISNFSVTTFEGKAGGLFGYCNDMTVKNLTVENAYIVSAQYAGAIVGNFGCTASGGEAAVINCHVYNVAVNGQQIGGVVGRASQSNADKGQLKVIGCTAKDVILNYASETDVEGISYQYHFVGGVIGAAGSTLIEGCSANGVSGGIYATDMATAGGVLGIQGANSVGSDLVNCYAVNVRFSARSDSSGTSTELGGLAGRLGHASNGTISNCYAADVEFKNASVCNSSGVVIGCVNSAVSFDNVYYVPSADLLPCGNDKSLAEYPFDKAESLSALKASLLNKGNAANVWVDDATLGYPVINISAVTAGKTPSAPAETTPVETTTPAPTETTTPAPEETTTVAFDVDGTPGPPSDTDTPESDPPKSEGGCGSSVAILSVAAILVGAACVVIKKKN